MAHHTATVRIDTSPYPVFNLKTINTLNMPGIPGYQHITMRQYTGGNDNLSIWKYLTAKNKSHPHHTKRT